MEALQNILAAIAGILIGGFIPFVLIYFALYLKHHRFGWKTGLGLLVRVILTPVALMLTLAVAGLILTWSGLDLEQPAPPQLGTFLGFGATFGFLAGIVAFVTGVVGAVRARRRGGAGGQGA